MRCYAHGALVGCTLPELVNNSVGEKDIVDVSDIRQPLNVAP